jgi:hypothetical protein
MNFCSHVHANYGQLAGYENSNSTILPSEIRNKMILTHYQDFLMEDTDFYGNPCIWQSRAQNDGFIGFVKVGDTYEI